MNSTSIRHAVDIASAFVAHNHLRAEELAGFITAVYGALVGMGQPKQAAADKPKPAVDLPWKKTVRPDYLISLIDGKHYRTLRRHLGMHGLTPGDYRARYDLPRDYPMVCAAYSETRSALAKKAGLGQQRRKRDAAPEESRHAASTKIAASADPAKDKPKRGRRKNAPDAAVNVLDG